MNCNGMLTELLAAELVELEGTGSSAVAVHVRQCAKCRAVARRLLAETVALRVHVTATGERELIPAGAAPARGAAPGSGRGSSRPLAWGGALAAAAAAVWMLAPAPKSTAVSTATGVSSSPAAPRVAEPLRAAVATAATRRHAFPKPVTVAPRTDPVPVQPTRFAPAVPATAVRFVASHAVDELAAPVDSTGVSVSPPAGKRSAVLATRNPSITIVWLY